MWRGGAKAVGSGVACAVALIAASADAQQQGVQSASDGGVAAEIVVTAQKRAERLSDVPLSITAATGEQLADAGVSAPADLVKVVPGFTYRPSDYGTPVFYMRGVGFNDVAIAVAPAVSVYVDQVPIPFLVEAQGAAFDLERVEALKGPQGTLFGQNSTGGAVNFIAAKPTEELKAGWDLTIGRFSQVGAQAFVSGPIAASVRARLTIRHEARDGWQISQTRPGDRLGVRDFTNARAIVDWDASDRLRLEFTGTGWMDRSETLASQFVSLAVQNPASAGGFVDVPDLIAANYPRPAPKNPRIADWGSIRPFNRPSYIGTSRLDDFHRDDSFFQFSLRGDLELSDAIDLTSISAFSKFKQRSPIDSDGTAFNDFGIVLHGSIRSFSQELRVAGRSGPFRWMAGGNYATNTSSDDQQGDYYGSNTGIGDIRYSTFVNSNRQEVSSEAGFGSVDYDVLARLTLQASARYSWNHDEFAGCLRDAGDGELARAFGLITPAKIAPGSCVTLDPATFTPVSIVTKKLDERNLSWRAGLNWKPEDDALIYANVTRGYKAGSFPTVPGLIPDQFSPVTQERVTAYEAGFKVGAFARRVQLTGAAFHYRYDDKQIIGYIASFLGNLPALVQIPRSRIRGFELSTSARPLAGLTLNAGATYVDARVTSAFRTNDPFGRVVDVDGERLPITPRWQLTGDLEYRSRLSDGLNASTGANVRWQSGSPAAFGGAQDFYIPGYAVVDLRAGIEAAQGTWKAQLWGRNVTNRFYVMSVTHVTDTVARTVGIGATYGVTLSYRY